MKFYTFLLVEKIQQNQLRKLTVEETVLRGIKLPLLLSDPSKEN
jgi:hypothetical protein